MKKRKMFASMLAVTVVAVSASSISVSAMNLSTNNWGAPDGYTALVDHSFLDYAADGEAIGNPYTVYTKISEESGNTLVEFRYNYLCNYTILTVNDQEKFETIYNEYKDKLNFSSFSKDAKSNDGTYEITFYDEATATDSGTSIAVNASSVLEKKDLTVEFVKVLQEAGVLKEAYYSPYQASGISGAYTGSVYVTASADEENSLRQIAETIDSSVETGTDTVTADGLNESNVTIRNIESMEDGIAIAQKIQEAYPEAKIALGLGFRDEMPSIITSPTLDLTTAHYTGDIDDDETIGSQDALDTLQYVSTLSAGGTDVTLTTGDDETEEAAALDAADVNADGEIDTTDAYLILKHYATEAAGGVASWE